MNNDATEAALGLLGLSPQNAVSFPTVPLKRKQVNISSSKLSQEHTSDAISCICGFTYDDGFSIACDDCSRWCHAACFEIVQGQIPEEWRCWVCVPRLVNREKAIKLQKARQKLAAEVEQEKQRRRTSPAIVERKQRRTSAVAVEGSKRRRRPSIIVPQATEDEPVDIDEPWALSYVPITKDIVSHPETHDKLRRQAQHWRGVTALQSTNSPLSLQDQRPIRLPENTVPLPPQTTIHQLPKSSFSHPMLSSHTNPSVRPPSYAMHTTAPIPSSQLITPYTSTIIPSSAYLSDPLNAYAHLGMPKPFVHLFGPPLDVTLDSRITGDKSRFVRSGCRPNAVLRPVLCPRSKRERDRTPRSELAGADDAGDTSDEDTLTFGVFALRDLKANEEVILGWEWDDGNAIHNLPALIESPNMFPLSFLTMDPPPCCSPSHMSFLRNQMASILQALSSTFTTCACGAKAKDCALTQMAAFVDGEIPTPILTPSCDVMPTEGKRREKRKVDLGPLIGVKRGFKTREKIPFSGGMTGVEMVPSMEQSSTPDWAPSTPLAGPSRRTSDSEQDSTRTLTEANTLAPPTLVLSPATASPTPKKRRDKKGKGKEVDSYQSTDDGQSASLLSVSGKGVDHNSNEKRSRRTKKRRRGQMSVEESPTPSPHPPETPMELADDLTQDEQEDRLPPRMRKRWMHRSSEAFKEWRSPSSPNGSTVSTGSNANTPADEADHDKMDVDSATSDSKHMPPPPMPASLDPTTISSIDHMRLEKNDSFIPHSPSASFSKLSLLSPIAPGPANVFVSPSTPEPLQHSVPSPSALFESTTSAQAAPEPDPLSAADNTSSVGSGDIKMEGAQEEDVSVTPRASVNGLSEPSPPATDGVRPPSLHLLSDVSPLKDDPPETHHWLPLPEENPEAVDNFAQPPDVSAEQSVEPEAPPSATVSEGVAEQNLPTPSTPMSPLPPQKVKMSLKDFALRKKKQREEEMAKSLLSPPSDASPASPSPSGDNPVAQNEQETLKDDAQLMTNGDHHDSAVPESAAQQNGHTKLTEDKIQKTERTVETETFVPMSEVNSVPTASSDNDYRQISRKGTSPPSPIEHIPISEPPNGKHTNAYYVDLPSLKAKMETMEELVPSGLVGVDERAQNALAFQPDPSPPPLNGRNKDMDVDPPLNFPHLDSRRSSVEEGEYARAPFHKPPSHYRSHTPPTRPRSFHPPPSSPTFPPAPSSFAPYRRPPAPPPPPPSALPPPPSRQSQTGLGPPSRPLPSGPRALRAGNHSHNSYVPSYSPSRYSSGGGSQFIPRGPSADRDRLDWDRERGWSGAARPRGRGSSGGWAR